MELRKRVRTLEGWICGAKQENYSRRAFPEIFYWNITSSWFEDDCDGLGAGVGDGFVMIRD